VGDRRQELPDTANGPFGDLPGGRTRNFKDFLRYLYCLLGIYIIQVERRPSLAETTFVM